MGSCHWRRMMRELRFAHWEALQPLPRMEGSHSSSSSRDGARAQHHNKHWEALKLPVRRSPDQASSLPHAPDAGAGLLHQKLQMLDCCMLLRRQPEAGFVASRPCTARARSGQTSWLAHPPHRQEQLSMGLRPAAHHADARSVRRCWRKAA